MPTLRDNLGGLEGDVILLRVVALVQHDLEGEVDALAGRHLRGKLDGLIVVQLRNATWPP